MYSFRHMPAFKIIGARCSFNQVLTTFLQYMFLNFFDNKNHIIENSIFCTNFTKILAIKKNKIKFLGIEFYSPFNISMTKCKFKVASNSRWLLTIFFRHSMDHFLPKMCFVLNIVYKKKSV